jgi:UDP-galactopyranose mutase
MKFDFLIVGAGYSGSVLAERITSNSDKKVLIVDKRDHIAGNAYDYYDNSGILVHKYGPHLFHTKMKKVWDYLSNFTEWHLYSHKVLAVIEGKKVPIPFNFNSIDTLFPRTYAEKLERKLLEKYKYGTKIPILKLIETEDSDLKFLADYIYKHVFLGYNLKQWGTKPEDLSSSVSGRIPVYLSRDDRYFQDQYQSVPKFGYTEMFNKIISNDNIKLLLKTDYKEIINDIKFDKLIFTGPIDEYFDNLHGQLPYRSLNFDFKTINQEYFQELTQVNYPNNNDYTRITEFKHLTGQKHNQTTIAYEYPQAHVRGENDPYYPIPNDENHQKFELYRKEAEKLENVFFTGRLANYKYYNMDETTMAALQLFNNKIAGLI